jgi:hypothetical protein
MKSTSTTSKSRSKTATAVLGPLQTCSSQEQRAEHIAIAAYYKAQARGFAPGGELEDWLQAEAELSVGAPAN